MIVHEETSNHDEKLRLAAKQIFNTGIHPNIEFSERNCVETFTNFSQAAILQGERHPDNTILGTSPYLGTLPVSPFFRGLFGSEVAFHHFQIGAMVCYGGRGR